MKVNIEVGYSKTGNISEDYKYWGRKGLAGADITIIDGKGNKFVIGSRENGTKVVYNGKEIISI